MTQKSFVFDANKCTGCNACQLACAIENDLDIRQTWRQVLTFNPRHVPGIPSFHLSLACNHCLDAPCMTSCPALAYTKDPESGAVLIEAEHCIGCKYCAWVCPYDAPKFDASKGIMSKCTFCNHRAAEGREPACVSLCPTTALQFGDCRQNGDASNLPGFPQTNIRPAIELIPLQPNTAVFQHSGGVGGSGIQFGVPTSEHPERKIQLRQEWPLVLFTLLAACLFAALSATVLESSSLDPWLFGASGMAGMGLSGLHLGQKRRAYRAVLNWRRSWLSREIIFYTAFLSLGFVFLLLKGKPAGLGYLSAFAGLACLFSMDKVYDVLPRRHPRRFHSAQVTLTGLLFWFLLAGWSTPSFLLLGLKAALYLLRKKDLRRRKLPVRPLLSLLRLLIGIVLPLYLLTLPGTVWPLLLGVLAGELIDRAEFYLELDVVTPAQQMEEDLRTIL